MHSLRKKLIQNSQNWINEFIWRSDGNIMDELSKFPYSVWLLRVLCFGYYYHKTSTVVYPVPRYFFTVNTVDEILSTAHP